MRILVTGAAGFIGMHLCKRLLAEQFEVVGIDNLNSYYSTKLKKARLKHITHPGFIFVKGDIENRKFIFALFAKYKPDMVVHLAAQAGVRYSIENPYAYIQSNIAGFITILEACRLHHVKHLLFASSSSVYGANTRVPFSEHDSTDHPVSLYAATKKANELMAHTYSHIYQLPATGLRFFTVYGPWGRPDMAPILFARSIFKGETIKVFNHGIMRRDFTYIDDVIECVFRLLHKIPSPDPEWSSANPDPSSSNAPFRIYNIGHNHPVKLMEFISVLEEKIGKPANMEFMPLQPGDVRETYADIEDLSNAIGYKPQITLKEGISLFIDWYIDYYGKQ